MNMRQLVRRNDLGIRDVLAAAIAVRLPRRVIYWTYVACGAAYIADDEVVPEVTYTEILQRVHRHGGRH